MTDHTFFKLVPDYVLDLLKAGELEDFEAHVDTCEQCRLEVARFRETTSVMAEAVPALAPPPGLKDKLMARVQEEAAAKVQAPAAQDPEVRSIDSAPSKNLLGTLLPWLVAGVGIAASIAFSIGLTNTRAELLDLEQGYDEARQRVSALEADSARADSILQTIVRPGLRTAFLSQSGAAPELHLFWSPDNARVLVTAFNLPPAETGRTYQLWGINAGSNPVSLGTFATSADGTALALISVPADATFEVSAVTDEPAGGSPQPTTQPFLVGTWSAQAP